MWKIRLSCTYEFCGYSRTVYKRLVLPFVPIPGMWVSGDFDEQLKVVTWSMDNQEFWCEVDGINYSQNTSDCKRQVDHQVAHAIECGWSEDNE